MQKKPQTMSEVFGIKRAIDGARTRGLHLGKVALYQLSYYRIYKRYSFVSLSCTAATSSILL